jgi:hypothetical protein
MNQKLNRLALANTFAVVDIALHLLFRVWILVAPGSYEYVMNLFAAGLQLEVSHFDSDISHIVTGTIIEAAAFWLLGFCVASIYNRFVKGI